jgi:ribosomal protein L16 Arg81 hydroxylase
MASRFLDSLTLQTLIAPIREDEFLAKYWQQQPLFIHRNDPDYYGDLFTLEDFDETVSRNPSYVQVADATQKKNTRIQPGSAINLESILTEMRQGSTLILNGLHYANLKLGLLCRLLGPQLGHRFQTNLYLTPPHGKGFTPHWDNHDVFILQTVGSKHWNIEKKRRALPLRDEVIGEEGRELQGEVHSAVLRQGDIIYIPRGYVHAAECGEQPSLHITLGLTAIFMEQLLHATVTGALQRDESLRVPLPIGFMTGDRKAVVQHLMRALREAADEAFLNGVVDQFRDELVRTFPLDVSGQLVDFYQPKPLALDDIVGPRRGMLYRTHVNGDDSVRLNFGARSITFPGIFRDSLDFALNQESYPVRDLPGAIEDEEKVLFIERLLQEGLVVRQPA